MGTYMHSDFRSQYRDANVRKKTSGSLQRYERACRTLAGGVSSGLRRAARPYPLFFDHGHGSQIVDVDGNAYLDYTLAWGPLILGHSPDQLQDALTSQVSKGLTFGAQHDLEYEVAERLVAAIPCADRVCFANSGTEIVQVALRLARAITGRPRFLKFEGHYPGWDDSVLVSYHPGPQQLESQGGPIPGGIGQLESRAIIAQWNDHDSVERAFAEHGAEISAVICEPMLCNSGCISPVPGFLEFLRKVTESHGTLLIFDEVITGFRLGLGGAQEFYGVTPDLATYAKAVGAGTPVSVLAGKWDYMKWIAEGTVTHAGTLNGNPLCLAAANTALEYLASDGGAVYDGLHCRGRRLRDGVHKILTAAGHDVTVTGEGPAFGVHFVSQPLRNYRDTLQINKAKYADFNLAMLDEGVLLLPDGRWYISTAHTDDDVDRTLAAVERAAA